VSPSIPSSVKINHIFPFSSLLFLTCVRNFPLILCLFFFFGCPARLCLLLPRRCVDSLRTYTRQTGFDSSTMLFLLVFLHQLKPSCWKKEAYSICLDSECFLNSDWCGDGFRNGNYRISAMSCLFFYVKIHGFL